ncbi:hypothetical protein AB5N19_08879 [Seiridium cardinale]|uniref:Uncharacterized protein n=1 Tax=Seiridium cardinale TaxID=138064 RepID=A0ABR2XKU8_9PEZI
MTYWTSFGISSSRVQMIYLSLPFHTYRVSPRAGGDCLLMRARVAWGLHDSASISASFAEKPSVNVFADPSVYSPHVQVYRPVSKEPECRPSSYAATFFGHYERGHIDGTQNSPGETSGTSFEYTEILGSG